MGVLDQPVIQVCPSAFRWKDDIKGTSATIVQSAASCVLCSHPAERIVSDRNVAESEVLDIMTIHFYSIMVGFGLAILTVVGCLAMLLGWFFYLGAKRRHSRNVDQRVHDGRLIGLAAWGEPDLTPPSTSAAAQAEVADLEALWTLPPHRASTETD